MRSGPPIAARRAGPTRARPRRFRAEGATRIPAAGGAAKRRSRAPSLCLAAFGALLAGSRLGLDAVGAEVPPCSGEDAVRGQSISRGRIASVNDRLELTLADRRELKIVGVDPPRPTPSDPDLDEKSGEGLARWLGGRDILFFSLGQRPDRWGRLPAIVFAHAKTADSPLLSVGEALLEAGLARFEPSVEGRRCRASLLAAEGAARSAALGLWADPYYAVIAATDRESFAEKAGTSVIVEGRVTGFDAGGYRAALFFGPRRDRHFSVTILHRNIKNFDAAGVKLTELVGRDLRVRGLLDMRFGPRIEISSPDEIEAIAQGRGEQSQGAAGIDAASSQR